MFEKDINPNGKGLHKRALNFFVGARIKHGDKYDKSSLKMSCVF